MDREISIIHSFLELKAKLAILPCTCTMYCTTSIAYTSRIYASGSEVIFMCVVKFANSTQLAKFAKIKPSEIYGVYSMLLMVMGVINYDGLW